MQLRIRPFEGAIRQGRSGRVSIAPGSRPLPEARRGGPAQRLSLIAWARVHGRELLFVDGNHFLLEVTARAFQGVGATCRTAGSPDEAIRILQGDARLRAMILDYEIPGGEVGDLVRRVRAIRPEIRLIGTSDANRRAEFARRGVERFVAKPWCLEDLVDAASA